MRRKQRGYCPVVSGRLNLLRRLAIERLQYYGPHSPYQRKLTEKPMELAEPQVDASAAMAYGQGVELSQMRPGAKKATEMGESHQKKPTSETYKATYCKNLTCNLKMK